MLEPLGESAEPVGRLSRSVGPVELQFLGVGGWRIATARSVLLTGPLFTRPSALEVGLGARLAPDGEAIDAALELLEVGPLEETSAILVGHGHYDHALDVPWLLAHATPRAQVLTNATTRRQLLPFAEAFGFDSARVEDVEPRAADLETPGDWIRLTPDLRVLPVRGDHAPHVLGRELFRGVRETPPAGPPGPVTEWLDGSTLAFLIDVLNPDGTVGLRVYYEDGVPREPAGQLPSPDVRGDSVPVDVALLIPGVFAESRWYPEFLVRNLRPVRILVQHWEDFFIPVSRNPPTLRFSDLDEFLARNRRVLGCEACVATARPGARFVVPANPQ